MDRRDGRRQLRRLRENRGWSWTDEARAIRAMARRLGVDRLSQGAASSVRRSIARWESEATSGTAPDERYQWVLAHLYAERDGRFDVGPGSEFLRLMSAFLSLRVSPDRIAELHDAVISWAEYHGKPAMSFGQALSDESAVAEAFVCLSAITERIGRVPFVRSQLAVAPLVNALDRTATTGAGPDVHLLAARAFAVAGRLAFETHDDDQARAYYAAALSHSGSLPDRWLSASTHTSLAMIAMHRGDGLGSAEDLAKRAVRAALAGSSMTARARAFAVQAEVAARRSLTGLAAASLRQARTYAVRVSPDDPAGIGFDSARLSGFVGLHCLLVGRTAEAIAYLREAADGIPRAADPVQRSIILADLAHGHAVKVKPEPEASIATLHECADLVADTRGRVAMRRIRRVRRMLRPWDGERFVADFDDHLYSALLDQRPLT